MSDITAMEITTVPQFRCDHSPCNRRGLSEEFLEPSQLRTAGVPPFVGKIDLELQTADYGILSGNKSFARPISSLRVTASPAEQPFMRTIVLAAAALADVT